MNSKNFSSAHKTRSELNLNRFETPELQNSINKLIEIGFLIPFTETDNFPLYHGSHSDSLKIDKFHKPWGSAMAFDAFYTTDDKSLAQKDYTGDNGRVYRIVPSNGGGYIFDGTKQFSDEEIKIIRENVAKFFPNFGEIPENNFIEKENVVNHLANKNSLKQKYQSEGVPTMFSSLDEAERFEKQNPEEFHILSQVNTAKVLYNFPVVAFNHFGMQIIRMNNQVIPIAPEYLQNICSKMQIIGVKTKIKSRTSGGIISPIVFFDFGKIQEMENQKSEKQEQKDIFSDLAEKFAHQLDEYWIPSHSNAENIKNLLTSGYISPEKVIASAKNISPKFAKIFEAETGVWEGYTLEQHTESVLENFENNFADKIPLGLLAFMRLVILVHDMGKDKKSGKKYDWNVISEFFENIGVSGKLKQNIQMYISHGAEFAGKYFIKKENDDFVKRNLSELSKNPHKDGILNMLYAFVVSDGGAYTNISLTRHRIKDLGILTHRNATSFDDSFEKPINNMNRYLQLKK